MTSVIIPIWSFDEATRRGAVEHLENLRATTRPEEAQIIIVHTGNPDPGLPNLADRFEQVDPAQGWAGTVNMGLLLASEDTIAVTSADIRLPDRWLAQLLEVSAGEAVASPWEAWKQWGVPSRWDRGGRGSFWGACFAFPRAVLDAVGYFDAFHMRRRSDMDWAIRARQAGFPIRRADFEALHLTPHHVGKHAPDPMADLELAAFKARHGGAASYGAWERAHP